MPISHRNTTGSITTAGPKTPNGDIVDSSSPSGPDLEAVFEKSPAALVGQRPEDFPDGGQEAWLVVLGAWSVSFCTWGYMNSFGVFQQHYQTNQLSDHSPSDISLIGSIQVATFLWGGLLTGRLFDKGYLRQIIAGGTIWTFFCFMMISLARTYWQILLCQGFGVGIGLGMLFVPAMSVIPHWFRARRAFANGVLATGSSIGGIIFPVMLNKMSYNKNIGFAWAVRATAFVVLALLVVADIFLKTRLPPNNSPGSLVDFKVFKDINYTIFVAGSWFILFGLLFPFFYLEGFADSKGVDSKLAFYTLSILNAASVFGRTIPNYLADKWGPLNILSFACFISGVLTLVFLTLKSTASFIVFAIIFGFFSGTYVSAITVCVASLTKDMRTIGMRMSIYFGVQGFAAIAGTPICGAIITLPKGSFVGAACFSGASVIIGSAVVFYARTRHAKAVGSPLV